MLHQVERGQKAPTVSLTLGSDASAEEVEPEASGAAIILFSGLQ